MSFWSLHFLPENERKQVDIKYHSSKVESLVRFLGESRIPKSPFEIIWPLGTEITVFTVDLVVTEFVILGTNLNFFEVNTRGSENVFPLEGNC